MKRMTRSLAIVGTIALTVALAYIPGSAATAGRDSLANSAATLVRSPNRTGTPSASRTITFHVNLGWRNQAGLRSLLAAVSDPRGSSYGHYLTPAQFEARFSPSASETDAVTSWLRSQGLS